MNAFRLVRLKTDTRTRTIPVLLTSATINGDDLQRATEMKVLGMTVGPHEGAKMLAAVKTVAAVANRGASLSERQRKRQLIRVIPVDSGATQFYVVSAPSSDCNHKPL